MHRATGSPPSRWCSPLHHSHRDGGRIVSLSLSDEQRQLVVNSP
ncbi:MAG: hypothetical protein R2701_03350 [Acidimicrobiales bacterium]